MSAPSSRTKDLRKTARPTFFTSSEKTFAKAEGLLHAVDPQSDVPVKVDAVLPPRFRSHCRIDDNPGNPCDKPNENRRGGIAGSQGRLSAVDEPR